MIRRALCWLQFRHGYAVYREPDATWTCPCGLRKQTDREWIQEIFSS